MPLGMEVGLVPGVFVFDGRLGLSYPQKKGTPTTPNFWPMSTVAKWLDGCIRHLVRKKTSAQATLY